MTDTQAAELAKTLQADVSAALADAADLEALQEPLQAVSTTLKRMSSDLGLEGLSGDAAKESLAKVAKAMLGRVDALVGIAGIAKEAATTIAAAQSAYHDLPRGYLTYTERQRLIEAGSTTGLPYIEAGLAAAREDAAATAVAAAATTLGELTKQLPEAADHYREDTPGGSSPGNGPGSRTPSPYVPPGTRPPSSYVPGTPPPSGGEDDPRDPGDRDPYDPGPVTTQPPPPGDDGRTPPGEDPDVPGPDDPRWPGPGDDDDTHGDDRPGDGTVYGPNPVTGGPVGGGGGGGGQDRSEQHGLHLRGGGTRADREGTGGIRSIVDTMMRVRFHTRQ